MMTLTKTFPCRCPSGDIIDTWSRSVSSVGIFRYSTGIEEALSKPVVDLPQVIAVLRDPNQEDAHDAAYSTLPLLDTTYEGYAPVLLAALEDQVSDAFVRWYALDAIIKVATDLNDYIPAFILSLADPDQGVRKIAAIALRRCNPSKSIAATTGLIVAIKDWHSGVDTEIELVRTLIKILGLTKAISALIAS